MDTTPQILAHAVRSFPERLALRGHGDRDAPAYTYRQLGALTTALAQRLAAGGVRRATPVALLCENRPAWAIVYFAIHTAGAICVPIDARLKSREMRGILQRSRAPLLVVSRSLLPAASEATQALSDTAVATVEDLLAETDGHAAADGPTPVGAEVRGRDTAVLSFTSGTTGASKAIVLAHRNIVSNAVAGTRRMDVGADDRLLSILPLNHLFEQTAGLLIPLIVGASVTYPGSLNPRAILDAMRQSGTTIALVVPGVMRLFQKRILSALESQPRRRQWLFIASRRAASTARRVGLPLERLLFRRIHQAFGGRLRFFICGGAPLDPRLARFFLDLGLPILEGYGLSEASPIVSCNTLAEHVIGSVGRPLPGTEVKIRAPSGADEGVGEVLVRGPNVMAGYFEERDATAEILHDGWLATGDLGRLDRSGYLHIVGRLKDVIVGESGKNVYPAEIEAELGLCPHVRETCVLGVPAADDSAHREEIVVLIVPNDETLCPENTPARDELLRGEIRDACSRLADYKRPKYIAVWPGEFPRTTTLKIRKHEVRRRLAEVTLKPL